MQYLLVSINNLRAQIFSLNFKYSTSMPYMLLLYQANNRPRSRQPQTKGTRLTPLNKSINRYLFSFRLPNGRALAPDLWKM